jgi:hypothetical protein
VTNLVGVGEGPGVRVRVGVPTVVADRVVVAVGLGAPVVGVAVGGSAWGS